MAPCEATASTSARMSPGRRSRSLPRRCGTMQKVHVLLQPTEIDTHAAKALSRWVGRVEGKTFRDSSISTAALLLCSARRSSAGSTSMLWVPKTASTHGALATMPSRICWARHPPTAICIPGRSRLTAASWPRLPNRRVAAFSRTEQVLMTTTSAPMSPASVARAAASGTVSTGTRPACSSRPAMRSESCSFIWQPSVRTA